MRYIIIALILCCAFALQAKQSVSAKDFIITAKGSGETLEKAKQNAMSFLSQNIFVEIQTDLKSSESLKNEDYKIDVTNNIQLQSNSYFSGLSFFNEKKENKNLYSVETGLSTESYNATVVYLKSQIHFSLLSTADRKELIIQKDRANFLISLLMYGKQHKLNYDITYYNSLVKYATDVNQLLLAEVVVSFQITPNNPSARILLNGESYKSFSNIFLSHGSYTYQVVLQGYKTKKGSIDVYKGDRTKYNIYLQKKLPSKYNVALKLENNSKISSNYFNNAMEIVANQNQMNISTATNNTLEWIVEPLTINSSFDNFYNISTKIIINLYENKSVKKSTVVVVNYLSKNNIMSIPTNVLDKQLKEKLEPFFASLYN